MKDESLVHRSLWLRGDRIVPTLRALAEESREAGVSLRFVADDNELNELIVATASHSGQARLYCQLLTGTADIHERVYVLCGAELSLTQQVDDRGLMQLMINPDSWDSLTLTIERRAESPLVLDDLADLPDPSVALAETIVCPRPFDDDEWVWEEAPAPTPRPLLAPDSLVPSGRLPDSLLEMLRTLCCAPRERLSEGCD
jgi:hypothetical protein